VLHDGGQTDRPRGSNQCRQPSSSKSGYRQSTNAVLTRLHGLILPQIKRMGSHISEAPATVRIRTLLLPARQQSSSPWQWLKLETQPLLQGTQHSHHRHLGLLHRLTSKSHFHIRLLFQTKKIKFELFFVTCMTNPF